MKNLLSHIVELAKNGSVFSDVQIERGCPVVWRRPEGWSETGYGIANDEDIIPLLNTVSREWKSSLLEHAGHPELRVSSINRTLTHQDVRLRCCAYTTLARASIAITVRVLPQTPPSIQQLNLPAQIEQFASMPKGLLLVSGATGSGKTTTISAITQRINETRSAHIVTIEEPVEIVYPRSKSIITQREVGKSADVDTFAEGVRESLRQRPDVIVIGEIRDAETAEAALRGAESGHYGMATVHARNAIGAVSKMLSFFPGDETTQRAASLSNTLAGVLFQSLMPSADGNKAVVAVEMIMNNNSDVAAMLAQPDKHRAIEEKLRQGQLPGGIHLNGALSHLVKTGKISRKTALAASYLPENLDPA